MTCNRIPATRIGFLFIVAIVSLAMTGCGEDGPTRYQLTGAVTFDGKPVPRGYIVFTPDTAAGNPGPGTQVEIVDGRFETGAKEGTIGGKHIASITGFDGQAYQDGPVTNPNGHLLFSDRIQPVDLPQADGQYDFSLTK
jgi:hypothetical protein